MIESMIAESMGRLGTETAFEVLARARALERQGKNVVHLEIGEPDYDTPAHIREAAKKALDAGATHYGPSAGLPELREAIAEHIEKTRGVPVEPDEVVVTPGAKPIMYFVIIALTNPGDDCGVAAISLRTKVCEGSKIANIAPIPIGIDRDGSRAGSRFVDGQPCFAVLERADFAGCLPKLCGGPQAIVWIGRHVGTDLEC